MGDSYREELKTHKKNWRRVYEAYLDRADTARNRRREAIKREQSRKALHWGKKKATAQGRLM